MTSIGISGVGKLIIDQGELLKKCLCNNPEESRNAVCEVGLYFDLLPDKQGAWDELVKLTSSEDRDVRRSILKTLEIVIQDVPDKVKVWNDLITLLTTCELCKCDIQYEASIMLNSVFQFHPDKQKAWEDLRNLLFENDYYIQWRATAILGYVFQDIPDTNKKDAWEILHALAVDKKCPTAAESLGRAFQYIPDKKQASEDILKLAEDEECSMKQGVLKGIRYALPYLVDKQKAWDLLVKLAHDKDNIVSYDASGIFSDAFLYTPNKQKAWADICKMSFEKDNRVKSSIPSFISTLFDSIPDKHRAWDIIHRLSFDDDIDVRWFTAHSIGHIFGRLSDEEKKQAWKDTHRLVYDELGLVKSGIAESFRYIFPHLSIKQQQQALDDIHRLTLDKDDLVRSYIAESIGFIFPYLPGKKRPLKDLKRLETDEHRYVSSHALHSLGKISIYNSSQAINEFDCKKELEIAISYFEKAAKRGFDLNPSEFCLPFYKSFHAIIFKENETEEQVKRYLIEAKRAIRQSNDKKTLYEAVQNLASALTEVKNLDFIDKKEKLNSCRKYCEIASELMKNTEITVPYATELIRKGLPILDRNLRELIEEIQKKTEIISEQTKGTQFEELGDELSINGQSLLQVRDPVGFKKQVNYMQNTLKAICSKLPEGQKGESCELLKLMYAEPSIEDKIPLMVNILSKFSYQLDMTAHLNRFDRKLDVIGDKLSCISFNVFKLKLNSHNVISNLDVMKKELERLNEIESLNESLMDKLDTTQTEKLNGLNKDILERLEEIKILIDDLPKNDDTEKIFDLLSELKQSDSDTLLQRSSAVVTLISFVIPVLQQILIHSPV